MLESPTLPIATRRHGLLPKSKTVTGNILQTPSSKLWVRSMHCIHMMFLHMKGLLRHQPADSIEVTALLLYLRAPSHDDSRIERMSMCHINQHSAVSVTALTCFWKAVEIPWPSGDWQGVSSTLRSNRMLSVEMQGFLIPCRRSCDY